MEGAPVIRGCDGLTHWQTTCKEPKDCAHLAPFHVPLGPSSAKDCAMTHASVCYQFWNLPLNCCELSFKQLRMHLLWSKFSWGCPHMGQRGFVKDSSAPLVTRRPWNKGRALLQERDNPGVFQGGERRKHLHFQTLVLYLYKHTWDAMRLYTCLLF